MSLLFYYCSAKSWRRPQRVRAKSLLNPAEPRWTRWTPLDPL